MTPATLFVQMFCLTSAAANGQMQHKPRGHIPKFISLESFELSELKLPLEEYARMVDKMVTNNRTLEIWRTPGYRLRNINVILAHVFENQIKQLKESYPQQVKEIKTRNGTTLELQGPIADILDLGLPLSNYWAIIEDGKLRRNHAVDHKMPKRNSACNVLFVVCNSTMRELSGDYSYDRARNRLTIHSATRDGLVFAYTTRSQQVKRDAFYVKVSGGLKSRRMAWFLLIVPASVSLWC